jgi:hypothetical protein
MKKSELFTNRDISVALNNLVAASLRPSTGEISDARLRYLRNYSSAILAPLANHVEDALLTGEELVCILVSAALFVQQTLVVKSEMLPQTRVTKILFDDVDHFRTEDRKV